MIIHNKNLNMSTWKYKSDYSKLQKKRRIESLIQSQKGALDKFFTSNKNNKLIQFNLLYYNFVFINKNK